MGLGKTVQTIAAILRRPRTSTEKQAGYTKATLYVSATALANYNAKNDLPYLCQYHHSSVSLTCAVCASTFFNCLYIGRLWISG
jgi:hypothetical protein